MGDFLSYEKAFFLAHVGHIRSCRHGIKPGKTLLVLSCKSLSTKREIKTLLLSILFCPTFDNILPEKMQVFEA